MRVGANRGPVPTRPRNRIACDDEWSFSTPCNGVEWEEPVVEEVVAEAAVAIEAVATTNVITRGVEEGVK